METGSNFSTDKYSAQYSSRMSHHHSKDSTKLRNGESSSIVIDIAANRSSTFILMPVIMGTKNICCCGPKIWARVVAWFQIVSNGNSL